MHEQLLSEVVEMARAIAGQESARIQADTKLLVEIDLDSLKLLELMELLRSRYGIDFASAPYSVRDLQTPRIIAAAIAQSRR